MIRKSITIGISNGLEARPIAMLVQVASQYTSNIYLESEARKVNAKSIMGMMSLGLEGKRKYKNNVSRERKSVAEDFLSVFCFLHRCPSQGAFSPFLTAYCCRNQ